MSCRTMSSASHKSRQMVPIALPLLTNTVTPSWKATKIVRHDLPLEAILDITNFLSVLCVPQHNFQEDPLYDFASLESRCETDRSVVP